MYAMMKATDHCNMGCTYCYVPREQRCRKERLSLDALPLLFRRMYDWQQNEESRGTLETCWSGGEVLTLPLDWWEKAFSIQQDVYERGDYTFKVKNSMQTNLTLLDDRRFEFLQEHSVGIGTSLDGPKAVMDKTRVFKDGRSAFDTIIKRITHLREKYDFVPGAIVVLSKANAPYVEEIFNFFNEIRVGFQVNAYHYAPSSRARHQSHVLNATEYLDAMCHLFDLWSERSDSVDISNFRRVTDFLLHGKRSVCKMEPTCVNRFYEVRCNGDIYPCNEFSGAAFEKDYCYGNLLRQEWQQIRDHPTRQLLLRRAELIQKNRRRGNRCRTCRYWEGCYGGCLHCTLKMQHRSGRDCSPEAVAARGDMENCRKVYGLYEYVEKKLREKSQEYVLPVLLYPDRMTKDTKKRRQAFYEYHRQMWKSSQIDGVVQLEGFQPLQLNLLGACATKSARRILHVCCGAGALTDYIARREGPGVEVRGVDYRFNGDGPVRAANILTCDDIMKWEGWQSPDLWDAIFVPVQYVHPDDIVPLLSLCEEKLCRDGVIIPYASAVYLRHINLLDVTGCHGIRKFDPRAIAVNCGGVSYTLLS